MQAAEKTGREVGSYVLFMVIADETDEAARAKWEHYKAGADEEALAWLTEQSQKDARPAAIPTSVRMADPTSAVNINMGTLVGSMPTSPVCSMRWRRSPVPTAYC